MLKLDNKNMTINKAILITMAVLALHALGLLWAYSALPWFDIPMHLGGGLAMAALAIGLWNEGIEEVTFKKSLERHLKWWLLPAIVLGFVALIGVAWELHEFVFDQFFPSQFGWRQPSIGDTMMDFVMDIVGGILAIFFWKRSS